MHGGYTSVHDQDPAGDQPARCGAGSDGGGINVPLTIGLAWALAAALSAIAGILLAPIYGVYAKMGALLSTKGFAAAVLGGYGNMYGAIIGGLLFGVVETMAAGYLSSALKDIISFGVLIAVLFVMPSGILRVKAD